MNIITLQAGGAEDFFIATVPIFYVLGMVLSVMFPLVVVLFWKRIMPPVLRTLFWAARRKSPLLLLCHDSGRSILTTITERQGEGIVLTAQGKYKILPRFAPKLPFNEMIRQAAEKLAAEKLAALPSPTEQALGEGAEKKEEEQSQQETEEEEPEDLSYVLPQLDMTQAFTVKTLKESFILDYSDYVNKRSTLIGLDLPVFVGYTGKLCLMNPEALALYEAGDMMIKTTDMELFNPNSVPDKDESKAMQPLMLMNPRKIQEIIWKGYDQSQIAGVVADSEELIRTQMSGGMSKTMKYLILFGLLAALAVAAVMFLPNLLGGGQQQGVAKAVALLLRR